MLKIMPKLEAALAKMPSKMISLHFIKCLCYKNFYGENTVFFSLIFGTKASGQCYETFPDETIVFFSLIFGTKASGQCYKTFHGENTVVLSLV